MYGNSPLSFCQVGSGHIQSRKPFQWSRHNGIWTYCMVTLLKWMKDLFGPQSNQWCGCLMPPSYCYNFLPVSLHLIALTVRILFDRHSEERLIRAYQHGLLNDVPSTKARLCHKSFSSTSCVQQLTPLIDGWSESVLSRVKSNKETKWYSPDFFLMPRLDVILLCVVFPRYKSASCCKTLAVGGSGTEVANKIKLKYSFHRVMQRKLANRLFCSFCNLFSLLLGKG